VQNSWFNVTLQLPKVSSRLSTRNFQAEIMGLWLFLPQPEASSESPLSSYVTFLPQPEAFHLNRHEEVTQYLCKQVSYF
jgi:hypothetical protein